ncbi:MAG TPA: ATP synthase F1 subunit epsilon [Candidatus Binataceae bacterium]|nr:ATP synthase F1 subunit epsilon [Candidatus Binataceae bacterium]
MADAVLPFKLITPTGVVFDDAVAEVTAVNPIGEFGVLPQHINYITSLVPCVITIKLLDGTFRLFVVSGGLVEIKDGVMTVLAPTAEQAEVLMDGEVLSRNVLAAEEKLQGVSFYEPGYETATKAVQLARARQRASELRTQSR